MSESTITSTGLTELRRAIVAFPEEHRRALRAVAQRVAQRVEARALASLQSSKYPNRARAITVTTQEDAANQAFRVVAKAKPRYPANLVLWIEHGTIKLPAQPFMRPAAQAETANYRREMEAASEATARRTFGD